MIGVFRVAVEFADLAKRMETMDELARNLGDASRELGLPYYALVHHLSLRRSSPRLIETSNYPPVWSERFVRGQLYVDDPVLHASQRTVTAFAWDDAGRLVRLTTSRRRILEQSRREGLGDGMTVPANVPGEPNGSCSFATRKGRALPRGPNLLCAEIIGLHAFERARELNGFPKSSDQLPPLSPREQECIRHLAGGASDKAIARQLKLSPETVRRYIKTARASYGAANRTALIVQALADGTVSFDDAIPPSG